MNTSPNWIILEDCVQGLNEESRIIGSGERMPGGQVRGPRPNLCRGLSSPSPRGSGERMPGGQVRGPHLAQRKSSDRPQRVRRVNPKFSPAQGSPAGCADDCATREAPRGERAHTGKKTVQNGSVAKSAQTGYVNGGQGIGFPSVLIIIPNCGPGRFERHHAAQQAPSRLKFRPFDEFVKRAQRADCDRTARPGRKTQKIAVRAGRFSWKKSYFVPDRFGRAPVALMSNAPPPR
jgi:hypothetical protein